jgi:hypothetical protein
VTEDEIIEFGRGLDGTVVFTATEANGSPEAAWGDSFFYYDPDDDAGNRKMPYATIVVHDYAGFDTASNLDREGVFRLNLWVGRDRVPTGDDLDPAALDTLIPHPTYAKQGWVSILSPDTLDQSARDLFTDAYRRAVERHGRKTGEA